MDLNGADLAVDAFGHFGGVVAVAAEGAGRGEPKGGEVGGEGG